MWTNAVIRTVPITSLGKEVTCSLTSCPDAAGKPTVRKRPVNGCCYTGPAPGTSCGLSSRDGSWFLGQKYRWLEAQAQFAWKVRLAIDSQEKKGVLNQGQPMATVARLILETCYRLVFAI